MRFSFFLTSLTLLLFSSCDDQTGSVALQRFSGAPGDVILIMEDAYWEGSSGNLVKESLREPYPMLPQYEPEFTVHRFAQRNFSQMLRLNRSIIIADIEDNARNIQPISSQKESKWANGQTVYTIQAKNEQIFMEEFQKVVPQIRRDISLKDRKRIQNYIRSVESGAIRAALKTHLQLELSVHKDFTIAKQGKDFMWLRRERVDYLSGVPHDVIMGIMLYTYPYDSDSLFSRASLIQHRDSILGKVIQSSKDSPMVIETILPAELDTVDFAGNFATELKGLWKFKTPLMGGPFISLSVVDEKRGRMITIDGYVFAPKFDKRSYVLELDALLYSLNF